MSTLAIVALCAVVALIAFGAGVFVGAIRLASRLQHDDQEAPRG